jgi:tetratricopeptide (TPR) repeat protein
MRLRVPLLAVLLVCASGVPARAETWYGLYLDARDKDIPNKRYKEALAKLEQAVRLKPESGLEQQTYGLEFIDYLPYFYQAKCYLALGDYNSAIRFFNIEEQKGKIKTARGDLGRELIKLRGEALAQQAGLDTAEKVTKLKQEIKRLRDRAAELHKAGDFDGALGELAKAEESAKSPGLVDPATLADIAAYTRRVRDEKARVEEAKARAQRIAGALADGQKLLQDGNPTEAKLKFETVLAQDAANREALDGKRRAEDEILASTTRATLEARKREGRALFDAGRYEEALRPLAEAASDPLDIESQTLSQRARKYVEGIQQQKEQRARVDQLMTEADRFLGQRRYADASVRFGSILEIQPDNGRARERLRTSLRLTGEDMIDQLFPNTPPLLSFMVPGGVGQVVSTATEAKRIEVIGTAFDDRGLARIQFLQGGTVVGDQDLLGGGDIVRDQRIAHTFDLAKGLNELRVVATDTRGLTREQTFRVTRTLLLYEQPWFLPSAAASSLALLGAGYAVQRTRRRRAVRSRFNPYIAGAPVLEDDMFFGRHKLLARIMNVLHHNSLMITGERRIGKTTLLHHLRKALERDTGTDYQFFPVSTDLQGVPEAGFFDAVMTDVAEQLPLRPETRAALRFRPGRETYDGRDFSHDLQRVVEDLATRTPKKVKLALLIDEVDVLNEYSERVNQRLRSIFMKNFSEHLVAIMSGVGIKRIWKSEGSPWYNFFDEIELTAFTREEAEALIRQPVEGVFRWAPDAVEAILRYSGLKPYVIQKFCIHAVNQMLESGRSTITAADVEAVRPTVLFERAEEVARVPETASA